jgi:ATP-dependent Clp protease ATP-binding subunit ClpA
MSVWIRNLRDTLKHYPVLILHGNVRDKYIDEEGRVYENLTALLKHIRSLLPQAFEKTIFYDAVEHERQENATDPSGLSRPPMPGASRSDLDATAPRAGGDSLIPPSRVFARWNRMLRQSEHNHFIVVFYLDKVVPFKSSLTFEEMQTLLWLEKAIENIQPNHRLILVALQDSFVPVELYLHAPNCRILPVPMPDKLDRLSYVQHRLGNKLQEYHELLADLTDGLFLRDVERIVREVSRSESASLNEVRRMVNKYRIGEQEDYWEALDIKKLNSAMTWFEKEEGVKGQKEPIRRLVQMLCLARAGLSGIASGARAKPKGVLFFAGPTGVGKTYLAKKLAKFLFSSEDAFLRFDMSEYKEEHTVSKLIGSPPGYVGYERGGVLTNAVRERPFCVILFDEIEKAHPRIMDIFLQILDDGRLMDSRGQTVFFTESIIIFTSNLGTRTTDSLGRSIDEREQLETILGDQTLSDEERQRRVREHFVQCVEHFFMYEISRPELLNRIGHNIVPFNYIHSEDVQREIVSSHLQRIKQDFEEQYKKRGYSLEWQSDVVDWLVKKHSERIALFGGRGITNAIEQEIVVPLSIAVLKRMKGFQGTKFLVRVEEASSGIRVE